MIFISFGASASTTEQFFGYCKTYQNNGFNLEIDTDVACHVAFVKLVEFGEYNCRWLKYLKSKNPNNSISTAYEVALNHISIEPFSAKVAIQSFLNWAEKNPDKWNLRLPDNFRFFLSDKFPCKLDE